MSANPLNATDMFPVDPALVAGFRALSADLTPPALLWISGYAAGLAAERSRAGGASGELAPATPLPTKNAAGRATVLYASQTGNGRRIAERLGGKLEAAGVHAQVLNVADYAPRQLAEERLLYLVVSTHGDGDAPDDARAFVEFLSGRRAPRLPSLAYSVLALGDSSYPKFCATGRMLDERLAELGARRLSARIDCDVDIDARATPWLDRAVADARTERGAEGPHLTVVAPLKHSHATPASREAPLEVEVIANQRITSRDAERDVRHVELALPETRFDYEPGDAIGLVLENPATTVDRILELTRLDPTASVDIDGKTHRLGEWLAAHRETARISRPFIERLAELSNSQALRDQLAPERADGLRQFLKTQQVMDLLKQHPAPWTAELLVRALNPLTPRLYSVASSRREVGAEAHLTVAVINYQHDGEQRVGPASFQVAGGAPGTRWRAFVEQNTRFRVPADGGRDVVMIGPGTGVAPYRGFLQQRVADGARGRNWLLFGGRHREQDFLYQTEWLDALKRGQLSRLDVAFSRDTDRKFYVQDRMREQGRELYAWLENGAHLYVCGDAERMAPDVHNALVDVIVTHGGRGREDALEYVNELARTKRYARDVY